MRARLISCSSLLAGLGLALLPLVLIGATPRPDGDATVKPQYGSPYSMPPPRILTKEECMELARRERLAKARRLERSLTGLPATEVARAKHELAKTYEVMSGHGELARRTYAEILDHHPGYERCPEVAYRLGSLYNNVILDGTERDVGKAIRHYEYVLRHCPPGRYVRLKAHMSLSILRVHLGQRRQAREHLEAIYAFDPELLELGPDDLALPEEEQPERMKYWRKRVEGIRANALGKLVAACREGNPVDTIVALDDLGNRYAHDARLLELVEKERANSLSRTQRLFPDPDELLDAASRIPMEAGAPLEPVK